MREWGSGESKEEKYSAGEHVQVQGSILWKGHMEATTMEECKLEDEGYKVPAVYWGSSWTLEEQTPNWREPMEHTLMLLGTRYWQLGECTSVIEEPTRRNDLLGERTQAV